MTDILRREVRRGLKAGDDVAWASGYADFYAGINQCPWDGEELQTRMVAEWKRPGVPEEKHPPKEYHYRCGGARAWKNGWEFARQEAGSR